MEAKSADEIRAAVEFFKEYMITGYPTGYPLDIAMTAAAMVAALEWVLNDGLGAAAVARLIANLEKDKVAFGEQYVSVV